MAGGAPSPMSDAIAQAAKQAQQTVEIDPSAIPPVSTEEFRTAYVKTESVDEARDPESDAITEHARVEVTLREPTLIPQPGGAVMFYGGVARKTVFAPDFCIAVGEELVKLGQEAKATMKEQPLRPVGLDIATPADVGPVAAAAEAAKQITSPN